MRLVTLIALLLLSPILKASDDPYPIAMVLRLDQTEFDLQVIRLQKCLLRIQYQRTLAPHSNALKDAEVNLQKAISDAEIIRRIRYEKSEVSGS